MRINIIKIKLSYCLFKTYHGKFCTRVTLVVPLDQFEGMGDYKTFRNEKDFIRDV